MKSLLARDVIHVPDVLADEYLPVYDVSDAVATVVEADVATTWNALLDADVIEVGRKRPAVAILGALRALPEIASHIVHGQAPPKAPKQLRLRELTTLPPESGGWVLLGERPRDEIALGLVGKFWRPVIEYAHVSAERFADFNLPGYAKTVYSLSVQPIGEDRTRLTGLMRTATTDEEARRWFRRYWTFGVGSGAHVLVSGLLDVVSGTAEARARESAPSRPTT
jgi:hypothetical protein